MIDLSRPVLVERADFVRQGGVARLVVQLRATSAEAFLAQARLDAAKRLSSRNMRPEPTPEENRDPRPLVVIDPGHGGIDPGASGAKGETEKGHRARGGACLARAAQRIRQGAGCDDARG